MQITKRNKATHFNHTGNHNHASLHILI